MWIRKYYFSILLPTFGAAVNKAGSRKIWRATPYYNVSVCTPSAPPIMDLCRSTIALYLACPVLRVFHANAVLAGHGPIEIAHRVLPDTHIQFIPYSIPISICGLRKQICGFVMHCVDMRSSYLLCRLTI